jgi:hypothetical protein
MTKLLARGYCVGMFSSRRIQGRVALDGVKVKANAGKRKAMSYGRMEEKEKQLREEVKGLPARAEAADADEANPRGEAGVAAAGAGEGGGRRQADRRGPTKGKGSMQFHGPGIADHEGGRWFCAGPQCAGGGGAELPTDWGAGGYAGH